MEVISPIGILRGQTYRPPCPRFSLICVNTMYLLWRDQTASRSTKQAQERSLATWLNFCREELSGKENTVKWEQYTPSILSFTLSPISFIQTLT